MAKPNKALLKEFYELGAEIKEKTKRHEVLKAEIKAWQDIQDHAVEYKDPSSKIIYCGSLNRTARRSIDQSLLAPDVREKATTEKVIESLSVIVK
jgi:hypothetical protein